MIRVRITSRRPVAPMASRARPATRPDPTFKDWRDAKALWPEWQTETDPWN